MDINQLADTQEHFRLRHTQQQTPGGWAESHRALNTEHYVQNSCWTPRTLTQDLTGHPVISRARTHTHRIQHSYLYWHPKDPHANTLSVICTYRDRPVLKNPTGCDAECLTHNDWCTVENQIPRFTHVTHSACGRCSVSFLYRYCTS